MNPLIAAAADGLIRVALNEFLAYQTQKARDAAWKPSQADVDEFLAQIASDSPDALKAKVASVLGIPWPPSPTPPS